MKSKNRMNVFLSDDDEDDCQLFLEAMEELYFEVSLTITNNGVKLMEVLEETVPPAPELIFLDLNMPRKNGFECLDEIRKNPKLQSIPVVILSTSSNNDVIDRTFEQGANYFICKPASFLKLKKALEHVLSFDLQQLKSHPKREQFVIDVS